MPKITDLPEATAIGAADLLLVLNTSVNPPVAKTVEAEYIAGVAPISAVADKTGAVTLTSADVTGLTSALAGLLPADTYARYVWSTRTISGSVNNYVTQPATMLRVNTVGSITITGFSGGSATAWHRIINISQNIITIAHQSAQSSAANRIALPGNVNRVIYPNQDAIFFYDPIAQRWRSPGCPYVYGVDPPPTPPPTATPIPPTPTPTVTLTSTPTPIPPTPTPTVTLTSTPTPIPPTPTPTPTATGALGSYEVFNASAAPEYNGIYVESGTHNGRPKYVRTVGEVTYYMAFNSFMSDGYSPPKEIGVWALDDSLSRIDECQGGHPAAYVSETFFVNEPEFTDYPTPRIGVWAAYRVGSGIAGISAVVS
jgi:hypothetical protein